MAVKIPGGLFVHIPRTGGTYVARQLESLGVFEPFGAGTHNIVYGAENAFCFVRHPVTWIESLWRKGHENWPIEQTVGELTRDKTWNPLRQLTYRCGVKEFDKFVWNVIEDEPGFVSRMYEWYIGPRGNPNVRWVGRQENLTVQLGWILTKCGVALSEKPLDPQNVTEGERPEWSAELLRAFMESERVGIDRWYGGQVDPYEYVPANEPDEVVPA